MFSFRSFCYLLWSSYSLSLCCICLPFLMVVHFLVQLVIFFIVSISLDLVSLRGDLWSLQSNFTLTFAKAPGSPRPWTSFNVNVSA